MKGKLYKTNNDTYILVDPTKETYDKGYLLGTSRESDVNKLFIKNCQAIERDNPTEEYILEVNGDGWDDHSYKGKRKKTEWDVEIEMEPYHDGEFVDDGKTHIFEPKWKPLLDENGCLILKRL
jgi:hypothetical protein